MDFLDKTFYFNTIQSWIISAGIIIGVIILAKITFWVFSKVVKKVTAKTKSTLDDIIVDMIEEPVVTGVAILGFWIAFARLTFPDSFNAIIDKAFFFAIIINVTWLIARTINALIEEYIVPLTEKTENDLDDQLIPILKKSIRSIIWIIGIIVALNNAGFDVGAVIAGLGIGGLALAMAAKDTVSNVFGGFTIFTDKPFKIKDRIKIGGFDGTVTEIGIRSTRLKTLEGRVVTIPNAKFADSMVENVSLEPNRKIVLNLGLTYDTSAEQIKLAMKILKDIIDSNNDTEENALISFNSFGDFSLGILFIYYIKKGADILNTQTDINLAILTEFNKNKLEFAFPTQTIITQNN
jgi:MscS family membrane protein